MSSAVNIQQEDDDELAPRVIRSGNKNEIKALSEKMDISGFVHLAISDGDYETVKFCIEECGIDVKTTDIYGSSYLHIACSLGMTEIARYLMSRPDGDVNMQDSDGRTPLHVAVGYEQIDTIRMMVTHPFINLYIPDNFGKVPLSYAIVQQNLEIVSIFFGRGVNEFNDKDQTVLMQAISEEKAPLVSELLQLDAIDINIANKDGDTALHFAARVGNPDIVRILLSVNGIDTSKKNNSGQIPFDIAKDGTSLEVVKIMNKL